MTHPPHDSSGVDSQSEFESSSGFKSRFNCNPESGDGAERSLTDFLQSNAPTPPPADSALRSQILTEIANHPHTSPSSRRVKAGRVKPWWLVPPAVAAAVLVSWVWPQPAMLTADERLELETYLMSSWTVGTTIETDPLDDWLEDGDPDLFDEF